MRRARSGGCSASYDGLEDPGVPIPPSSTAIHGITDAMVAGQRIDDQAGRSCSRGWGSSSRTTQDSTASSWSRDCRCSPRCRGRVRGPRCRGVTRGSRVRSSSTSRIGTGSSTTGTGRRSIASRCSRCCAGRSVSRAHRAQGAARLGAGAVVPAVGEQFAVRVEGRARKRGYWWDAPKRCWYGEFRSREEIEAELPWLRETVFGGKSVALDLDEFDARTRYSGREGKRGSVRT